MNSAMARSGKSPVPSGSRAVPDKHDRRSHDEQEEDVRGNESTRHADDEPNAHGATATSSEQWSGSRATVRHVIPARTSSFHAWRLIAPDGFGNALPENGCAKTYCLLHIHT